VGNRQLYRIYPNPNAGEFVIQQEISDTSKAKVVVTDAVGRIILRDEIRFYDRLKRINLQKYPAGLYLLEITDSKNQLFRSKFVISK
jgi:hypothetical protein